MLDININMTKNPVEIRFAKPGETIKKASLPWERLKEIGSILDEIRRVTEAKDSRIQVKVPANYEGLHTVSKPLAEGGLDELVGQLYEHGIETSQLLVSDKEYPTPNGYVIPVALVPPAYILLNPEEVTYTTNLLDMIDCQSAITNKVTIVQDPTNKTYQQGGKILIVNKGIPVLYTDLIQPTEFEDLEKMKYLPNRVRIGKSNLINIQTEEPIPTEEVKEIPKEIILKSKPKEKVRQVEETESYEELEEYDDYEEVREVKVRKPKKVKRQREDEEIEVGKKKQPKIVFLIVMIVLVGTVLVSISGKLIFDMILDKGNNNQIEITGDSNIPLTTYISSAMTATGVRANKVSSAIREDGKEVVTLLLNDISDNDLLNLKSRLEVRCVVDVEQLELLPENQNGNRVSLDIYFLD